MVGGAPVNDDDVCSFSPAPTAGQDAVGAVELGQDLGWRCLTMFH